jgi:uncharacterized protein (TIGR03067 family)
VNGDLAQLQGEWEMVSAVRDGQPLGADFVSSGRQVLRGDVTIVRFRGQVFMQGTTAVDVSHTPKTIDYLLTHAPGRGKRQLGIWERDGDLLRICVALPGRPRPADFSTRQGDDRTLMVWRPGAAT